MRTGRKTTPRLVFRTGRSRISLDIRDGKSIPRPICLNGGLSRDLFYLWCDGKGKPQKYRNCTRSMDTDGFISIPFHFRRFRFPLVSIELCARYMYARSESMQPSPRSFARSHEQLHHVHPENTISTKLSRVM